MTTNLSEKTLAKITYSKIDKQYLESLSEVSPNIFYSNERITELVLDVQKDKSNKSRDLLIFGFGKYVISIAKHYINQGLPLSDLISEGILGLIIAIENFDTTKGVKFVTYVHQVIGRYIREAIDYSVYITKLPKNIRNERRKALAFLRKKELEGITPEELSIEDVPSYVLPYLNKKDLYLKTYAEDYLLIHKESIYDSSQLEGGLPTEDADSKLNQGDLTTDIMDILHDELPTKLRNLIELYYGINHDYAVTSYIELGKKFNLSPQEVKDALAIAISSLKAHSEERLSKYL